MAGGYQTQIYNQPAQGIAGDRASQNPIATFDAGPGGLVADTGGVAVGYFAWVVPPTDPNGTNQIASQARGSGNVAGFVYNDLQALNTVFLSDATMVIPTGLPVALATQGDWWVINNGTTEAIVGNKAYATFTTGAVSFAATGSPSTSAQATTSTVTAQTNSWTASIQGDIMTVTVGANLYPGTKITGTGVATGTQISAQLPGGTPLGAGTYLLSISQQTAIASEAMTGTYGLLTIGTLVGTATFQVGQQLAVTGSVVAGTTITANVAGTGGTGGTMIVNNNTALSQTIYTAANIETKWVAASAGQPGQLVKITSWVGAQG
jgi:hypothetical protein